MPSTLFALPIEVLLVHVLTKLDVISLMVFASTSKESRALVKHFATSWILFRQCFEENAVPRVDEQIHTPYGSKALVQMYWNPDGTPDTFTFASRDSPLCRVHLRFWNGCRSVSVCIDGLFEESVAGFLDGKTKGSPTRATMITASMKGLEGMTYDTPEGLEAIRRLPGIVSAGFTNSRCGTAVYEWFETHWEMKPARIMKLDDKGVPAWLYEEPVTATARLQCLIQSS